MLKRFTQTKIFLAIFVFVMIFGIGYFVLAADDNVNNWRCDG